MKSLFTVIDLFAGAGGFSQGFLQVNGIRKGVPAFKIIKVVELDESACDTLREHLSIQDIPVEKVLLPGNLESETVKHKVIVEGQGADVVIGGPPCQTFSLAGPARVGSKEMRQKLQNDPRNRLYKHFLEIVKGIQPSFVVFENVEGIVSKWDKDELSGKSKRVIEFVTESLRDIGYDPSIVVGGIKQDYMKLNAADYGVPQFRKRVIIIANNLNIPNPIPKPVCGAGTGKPYNNVEAAIASLPVVLPPINTVRFEKLKKLDLLAKYPHEYLYHFVKVIENLAKKRKNKQEEDRLVKLSLKLKEAYRYVETYKGDSISILRKFADTYNENLNGLEGKIYDQDRFPAPHISRPHNLRDVCIFSRMKPGMNSARFMKQNSHQYDRYLTMIYPYKKGNHDDTYVKQRWDSPSTTILSHMDRDGLRFIHPEQPRTFTPCEAALLQSFSMSSSRFHGTQSDIYRQIGNAVPPLMARAIGEAIYSSLVKFRERNNDNKYEQTY